MDLQELLSLIKIKEYVSNAINTIVAKRDVVNELVSMQLLLDKKILSIISSDEFKQYINFSDAKKVVQDAVKLTNLKSGMKHED